MMDHQHKKILGEVLGDQPLADLCTALGITRATWYGWCQHGVPERKRAKVARHSQGRILPEDFRPMYE